MADRFQKLANGDIYDTKEKKIIKRAEPPKPKPAEEPKAEEKAEEPKQKKGAEKPEKVQVARTHTAIARKILQLNRESPIDKTDPKQLWERGIWYFELCEEGNVTPTPQGMVNAWGFKAFEENLLLSGNSGLNAECKEVISSFKQALEQVAEGSLVDTTSGVVGRIFDLKNRFGWKDEGNTKVETEPRFGELITKEELKRAMKNLPSAGLIDDTIIDADFEIEEIE